MLIKDNYMSWNNIYRDYTYIYFSPFQMEVNKPRFFFHLCKYTDVNYRICCNYCNESIEKLDK